MPACEKEISGEETATYGMVGLVWGLKKILAEERKQSLLLCEGGPLQPLQKQVLRLRIVLTPDDSLRMTSNCGVRDAARVKACPSDRYVVLRGFWTMRFTEAGAPDGVVSPGARVEESVSVLRLITWTRLSPEVPTYSVLLSEERTPMSGAVAVPERWT
jgi:hypothetical protein